MSSKLIVLKVGTGSLTGKNGTLDVEAMHKLVDQMSETIKEGNKLIFVTSGAIAAGIAELKVPPKPNDIVFQQVKKVLFL